jgi:Ras-related GTP-binding protein A/B
MENYMTAQRDQIFKNVQVLIYVFDVESREVDKVVFDLCFLLTER